jgi:hypothetical protein
LLEADEQLRRDERAELELRSHVGELAGAEADSAFQAVDETIGRLVAEKQSANDRIAELDALLDFKPSGHVAPEPEAARPETAVAASAQPSAPTARGAPATGDDRAPQKGGSLVTPGGSFDELAFLSEVVGEEERRAAQSTRPGRPAAPSHAPQAATASPQPANAPHAPANSAPHAAPHSAPAEPASQFASAPGTARPSDAHAPPTDSGLPRRGVGPRREDPNESLLAGMEHAPRRGLRDAPLAANVASNTPIVLRATGAVEQSKTLKCNECGALNYPTEWYCERCGAELAAL